MSIFKNAQLGGNCGCGGAHTQVGGVSDFMGSFYAQGAVGGPGAITRVTLDNINNAPMFHALSETAVVPTLPSTGIVPSEVYLATNVGSDNIGSVPTNVGATQPTNVGATQPTNVGATQPTNVTVVGAQLGGASDFISSFYSRSASGGPGAITRATLDNIENSPMFHPLAENAVIPTLPSTGIVPSEAYVANMQGGRGSRSHSKSRSHYSNSSSQPTLDHLRAVCNNAGLTCRDKSGLYLSRDQLVQLLKSKNIRF